MNIIFNSVIVLYNVVYAWEDKCILYFDIRIKYASILTGEKVQLICTVFVSGFRWLDTFNVQ